MSGAPLAHLCVTGMQGTTVDSKYQIVRSFDLARLQIHENNPRPTGDHEYAGVIPDETSIVLD